MITIGYIQKAHSIHGELFLRLKGEAQLVKNLKIAHLRSPAGEIKTYNIIASRPHKDGMIIEFEGINTRNLSEELKGFEFVVENSNLVAKSGEKPFLYELLNFSVVDSETDEVLGEISEFSSNGKQDLAIVKSEPNFVFPLVSGLIEKIDYENKKIRIFNIPGLREVAP